jgi:hypothetical protein
VARTRLISADTRSGLLVVFGVALGAAAFALGTSAAGMVAGLAIAALAIGSGLAGTASSGRGTIPMRAQAAYDEGLAFGLLAIAVVFGVAGDPVAGALFGVSGAVMLLICFSTRYTSGARRTV